MADQDQTNTTSTASPKLDDVIVSPDMPAPEPDQKSEAVSPLDQDISDDNIKKVAAKVQEVHNILIALSSDPSVDEIAAAIGLSLCLDRAGKRATSIYSGQTPNALEFLKPEETFETTSDVLRDFVIALDKDKADHLRYKLDGDYVKIFITPYKTRIDEDDLEFSLGDFNIELVLALNVASGIDLDNALREHGRVMHDAVVVNITNGNPGKFGDIEWSDKSRSSVCEMAASLLYEIGGKNALEPNEATALLTGIVAATDHFSNNSTTADALQMGSKLMNSGADRELISENIGLDSQNMFFHYTDKSNKDEEDDSITIDHRETDELEEINEDELNAKRGSDGSEETENAENSELLSDLQKVADDLSKAESSLTPPETESTAETEPTMPEATAETPSTTSVESTNEPKKEMVINPSASFIAGEDSTSTSKYEKMLEDALAEPTPVPTPTPISAPTPTTPVPTPEPIPTPSVPSPSPVNPAASVAPSAPQTPEINGVPDINYMPMPGDEVLPPPPTPPIDFNQVMPTT